MENYFELKGFLSILKQVKIDENMKMAQMNREQRLKYIVSHMEMAEREHEQMVEYIPTNNNMIIDTDGHDPFGE